MVILIYPQLEGVSAKHDFEVALVMCGKVVNEDTSNDASELTLKLYLPPPFTSIVVCKV